MQLRTIAFVFSIVGIFYSGFASALGLGEITLKSQFNQPLNAEIRLLKVRDLSKEEIFTGLASREDFNLVGVDRLFFLSNFDFEVVLKDPSNPIIKVTSSKPITEPYLNFLVEVQWPSGRLLREYTLLLDLPVFNEASASAPINLPSSVAVASPVQVTPAPQATQPQPLIVAPSSAPSVSELPSETTQASIPAPPTPRAESSSSVVQSSNVEVDDYKVKSGDTLWEITETALAGSSASVNQKMVAILQANPNAFIKGNVNRLKNGRVLRIPTNEEVANVGFQQALDMVREQNQAWSTDNTSAQKAVLTSAAPTVSPAQSAAPVEGRLILGSADSGQSSVKGSGASGSGESLQNELAIANDELSRSTRQNEELSLRVSELESQIETMESLVSVTSDQLKALELMSKDSIDTDVSATDAELANTSAESLIDQGEVNTQAITAPEASAALEEPAVFVVPEPATPNNFSAGQQPSLIDTVVDFLKTNMLLVGAAVLAFLVAVLLLLRLKKKPEDELEDFALDGEDDDLFDLNEENLNDSDDLDDKAYAEDNAFYEDEDLDESVQAQTEDVVAEADIYVSLGQEDKAIELLQKEIQQNPDNADARLGLLKIYAKLQNPTGFDEQYAQLLPLGNVYANDQAMALRKEIENAEPFDTDQYSLKDDGLDFLDEVDTSDLDVDTDKVTASTDEGSIAFSEIDSDFDLDELSLDVDDVADEAADVRANKVSSDSADTDFSLDFAEFNDEFPADLNDESIISTDLEVDDGIDDIEFSLDLDEAGDGESTGAPSRLDSEIEVGALDEMGIDLDLDDDFSLDDEPVPSRTSSAVRLEDDLDNDFSLDLDDDFSLDDEPVPSRTSSAVRLEDDLDNDFSLDLDDDFSLDDEPVPSRTSSAVRLEDDLDNDFSLDLDGGLSLDDELDPSSDSTHISLDDGLGNDFSVQIDEDEDDDSDVNDFEFDIPADDSEDLSLSLDDDIDIDSFDLDTELDAEVADEINAANSEVDADDSLDLDSPPPTDIDMASLDDEIEAMTAGMDSLSVDEDEVVEPTETAESLNLEDDKELELSRDEDKSISSDLNISDANNDAVVTADDELDFFEESDEVSTKLDLAKAYMDMGDREGAEDILNEVMEEGNDRQKSDAKVLMENL
jgi:pilus assembly protein FimV